MVFGCDEEDSECGEGQEEIWATRRSAAMW